MASKTFSKGRIFVFFYSLDTSFCSWRESISNLRCARFERVTSPPPPPLPPHLSNVEFS